jgi:hypothetical protein
MGDYAIERKAFERRHLDGLVQLVRNAEEEYGQWLDEYEQLFGKEAREEYEEKHL